MSRRGIGAAAVLTLFVLSVPLLAQDRNDRRSARRERANRSLVRWLDNDVTFIITGEEKKAFKILETDEEREQFIEQFWLRRDPTPDTLINEYKEEHYMRIAYANEHYASGKPGWKTDRGRIYIVHGPPDSKEAHPSGGAYSRQMHEGGGTTQTYPFEFWRYRYIEGIGSNVEFEFVDPTLSGEYRMTTNPFDKDALAGITEYGMTEYEKNEDDKFSRNTGVFMGAALYGPLLERQLNFDRLETFARAFRAPAVKFKDLEAIVLTKLSYNLLPFDVRTDFIKVTEESILTPVTVQIQNKQLAFQQQDGIHRAMVNVFGRVTGVNGRVAQTFEDTISLDVPDALFDRTLERNSVYQKVLPLRPGLYKLDLVLKDIHSNNVGTSSQRLAVPRFPEDRLASSSLILADLIEELPPRQVASGQFILGNSKVRPNVTESFTRDQSLNVWLQVYNLEVDEQANTALATVETLITRDGKEVKRIVEDATELSGAAQQLTLQKTLPLAEFEPGEYSVQITVTDKLAEEIITSNGKFVVR